MKRKTNISVRNNINIQRNVDMIVGDKYNGYVSGDILDANATKELVDKGGVEGKLDAPTSPGQTGDLLSLDQNGNTIWTANATVTSDTEMSDSSTNPVQNKVIKEYVDTLDNKVTLEFEDYVTKEEFTEALLSLDDNYYGIRWTDANTTPVRIGNTNMHRSLPI